MLDGRLGTSVGSWNYRKVRERAKERELCGTGLVLLAWEIRLAFLDKKVLKRRFCSFNDIAW